MPRLAVFLVLLAACKSEPKEAAPPPPPPATPPPVVAAPAPATVEHHGLSWYVDDGPAALAAAKASGKPVLVDLWAPWCHTCLSMQNYVLTAKNLPALGERFVLLSINTEKPENAAFLPKVPVDVWPTFYVYDAVADRPAARWLGSASPSQFMRFLEDGAKAVEAKGAQDPADPMTSVVQADVLMGKDDYAGAGALYSKALAAGPAEWPRRPDVLVSLITARYKAKDWKACVALGEAHMQETGRGVSASDFAVYTVQCAGELDAKDPARKQALAAARARLEPLCNDPSAADLTPDDRGDACGNLAEAYDLLGDKAKAQATRDALLALLAKASAEVPPEVALTYDGARTSALIDSGRPLEALTFLSEQEKALPDSYLPPHYQCRALRAAKKYDEALAACDRAISRAYGPRKASIWGLKASICRDKKDVACERAALEGQIAAAEALPDSQRPSEAIKAARTALEALE